MCECNNNIQRDRFKLFNLIFRKKRTWVLFCGGGLLALLYFTLLGGGDHGHVRFGDTLANFVEGEYGSKLHIELTRV